MQHVLNRGNSDSIDTARQSTFFGRPLSTSIQGRDPIAGRLRYPGIPYIQERVGQYRYQTVKCLLDAGADRNTRDRYLLDMDEGSFEFPSILSEALRVEPDYDIVQLLLDSEALCDRSSIDRLYHGETRAFGMFQELKDHNIEGSQIKYLRQLAVDANLGWDRALEDLTASKIDLSGSNVFSLFFNAARFGRLQVMEKMISIIAEFDGKDLNAVNEEGETALVIACRHSHSEIVNALITKGANIDSVGAVGYTALMTAVHKNNVDCVSILLQHGADVRATNGNGATALHFAACHETPQMLKMILQSPAAIGCSLYTRDNPGFTLLAVAAHYGSLPTIEYILEHFEEASPFDRLQDDSTCLHLAAQSGRISVVEFFLDRSLSANDYNKARETPVYSAIRSSNPFKTVQILHTRGADLDLPGEGTGDIPLFEVTSRLGSANNADVMSCFDYLLEHTADVNYCDNSGKNCLYWLAKSFQEVYPYAHIRRACLALLQRGCSMMKCDSEGISPFQSFVKRWSEFCSASDFAPKRRSIYSERWGEDDYVNAAYEFEEFVPQVGMTLFILKHVKADPEILGTPDSVLLGGVSLLALALRTADEGVIRQVLEYDRDVDKEFTVPDLSWLRLQTPLGWLCDHGSFKMTRDLLRNLLSLSQTLGRQGPSGFAPIHIAAECGNVVVLEELLNMGIEADSLSSDAKSPLMYACEHSQVEAMRLLYERGARVTFSGGHDSVRNACERGHKEVLSTLFDMPELKLHWGRTFESVYLQDRSWTVIEGMTYFHHAAYMSQADVLDWLLKVGLVHDVHGIVGDGKFTALYLATWHPGSYEKTLPLLLSKGADVSSTCGTMQWTALHVAAIKGRVQAIEVLLSYSADPRATDHRLLTPYALALENNQPLAAQRILERGMAHQFEDRCLQVKGNIIPNDDLSLGKALRRFAKFGQADIVEILLDNGVDVNARTRKGTTAVMKASKGGHLEVLDLLKDRGADFAAKDSSGEGALNYACKNSQTLVVPGLLELGLNFTDSSYHNWTPLHNCFRNSYNKDFHDIVMAHTSPKQMSTSQLADLLNYGLQSEGTLMMKLILSLMDIAQKKDAINNLNYAVPSFALHRASFEGSVEKLEMLLDAGGEIDLRSEKIGPPLACAASMGRMEAVQFLAKKGAKFEWSMADGTKENAIDAAKNYPKVQQWMRDFCEKEQGLESECAGSDESVSLGTIEEEISEAAGV